MMSIWSKVRHAAGVACLLAVALPFAAAGVAGGLEATTTTAAAKRAKKPVAKGKAAAAGKAGSGKTRPSAVGKSTKGKRSVVGKKGRSTASRRPTAQTIRLTSAFKASEQLRPMAQQLVVTRSAAAYGGVQSY